MTQIPSSRPRTKLPLKPDRTIPMVGFSRPGTVNGLQRLGLWGGVCRWTLPLMGEVTWSTLPHNHPLRPFPTKAGLHPKCHQKARAPLPERLGKEQDESPQHGGEARGDGDAHGQRDVALEQRHGAWPGGKRGGKESVRGIGGGGRGCTHVLKCREGASFADRPLGWVANRLFGGPLGRMRNDHGHLLQVVILRLRKEPLSKFSEEIVNSSVPVPV